MKGPLKKFLILLLLWSGFGFALNQYLEQKPVNTLTADSLNELNTDEAPAIDQTLITQGNNTVTESIQKSSENSEALNNGSSEDSAVETVSLEPLPGETTPEVKKFEPLVLGLDALDIVRNTPEVIWKKNWKDLSEQLNYNMRINPDLTLEIIGHYDPSEPIADPNLGVQRSVIVKNELVAAGLNPDRIKCRGDLQRLFDKNSSIPPIVIKPSMLLAEGLDDEPTIPKEETSSVTVQENSPKNPNLPKYNSIVYHPSFSDQGIIVNSDLNELTQGISQWLALDPQNYLELWGHTDHVGHDQDNYRLALKWAQQLRRFFISQGIDPNRLKAFSAGEQQPLYTNSNSRGRLKNRRVELIFKY